MSGLINWPSSLPTLGEVELGMNGRGSAQPNGGGTPAATCREFRREAVTQPGDRIKLDTAQAQP